MSSRNSRGTASGLRYWIMAVGSKIKSKKTIGSRMR
jgi:hypothetical protein